MKLADELAQIIADAEAREEAARNSSAVYREKLMAQATEYAAKVFTELAEELRGAVRGNPKLRSKTLVIRTRDTPPEFHQAYHSRVMELVLKRCEEEGLLVKQEGTQDGVEAWDCDLAPDGANSWGVTTITVTLRRLSGVRDEVL